MKPINEVEHISSAVGLCIHNILDFGHIFNKELVFDMTMQKLQEVEEPTPLKVFGVMHGIIDYYHSLLQSSTQILTLYLVDIAGLGMLIEKEGLDVDVYDNNVDIIVELYTRFSFENTCMLLKERLNDPRATLVLERYSGQLEDIEKVMSPTLDYFLTTEAIEPFGKKKEEYLQQDITFVLYQHELMLDILSQHQDLTLPIEAIKELYLNRIKSLVVVNIDDIDLEAGLK